jgi:hypothetical protein
MKAAADALKSEHSNALQQAETEHRDETKQARDALEAKHSNEMKAAADALKSEHSRAEYSLNRA